MLKKIRRMVPFPVRVEYFRMKRTMRNYFNGAAFTTEKGESKGDYPFLCFSHTSRLIRDYPEPWYSLQYNKIENLKLAVAKLGGAILPPNKNFSFWTIVGRTSGRKGYKEGMVLVDGCVSKSVGGGLCQISNALYWTALHLGFEIMERHRHSFDIFPDTKRTVPFGAGATVNYNYVDLVFKNNSTMEYYFDIFLDEEFLHIDVYSNREPELQYRVVEENHVFTEEEGKQYRNNELIRHHINKEGAVVEKEFICANKGLVLYDTVRA
ncbi:MAG: VanW family protein [bacterium]|nr:VanW family protein [bacterium]